MTGASVDTGRGSRPLVRFALIGVVAAMACLVFAAQLQAQNQNQDQGREPAPIPPNACDLAFNNRCDDRRPGGTGMCPLGGDFADCEGRDRLPTPRATLFGYDDRQLFDTAQWPWRAIGELSFDTGSSCSGVLIDEDVVLTAAHCILHHGAIVADADFVTARNSPRGPARARVLDGYVMETVRDDPDFGRFFRENSDWALLKLDRAVGTEVGFLPVQTVTDNRPLRRDLISFIALAVITFIAAFALKGVERRVLQALAIIGLLVLGGFAVRTFFGEDPRLERVWQAGFSGDTGSNLSGSDDCRILEFRASGLIGHNCDTVPGDSGSPLLVRRNGDWAIIAVISHTRLDPGARDRSADRAYAVSSAVVPDPDAVFGTQR